MTRKTAKRPEATVRAAEIVREYGPFAGADRIAGVTHDGHSVWAATGARLIAFDPESGEPTRTLDRACDAGTAFDGTHLYQIAEARIDKIDPGHRRRGGVDPGARPRQRLGAHLGRGQPVGGAVPRSQDPPDRSRDRRGQAHHRVQPLRHRRDLGRRRAVARHLGRRTRATSAASTRTAAPCSSGWRCRAASTSAASSPTAPTCSIAAAGRPERCAPCGVRNAEFFAFPIEINLARLFEPRSTS